MIHLALPTRLTLFPPELSVISTNQHPSGFGAYNYYHEAKTRHQLMMIEEEERLAKNRELMDAYGSKDSLRDVQQALDAYSSR